MQEHQTADPERRSHLLRKASNFSSCLFQACEGALLAQIEIAINVIRNRFANGLCGLLERLAIRTQRAPPLRSNGDPAHRVVDQLTARRWTGLDTSQIGSGGNRCSGVILSVPGYGLSRRGDLHKIVQRPEQDHAGRRVTILDDLCARVTRCLDLIGDGRRLARRDGDRAWRGHRLQ